MSVEIGWKFVVKGGVEKQVRKRIWLVGLEWKVVGWKLEAKGGVEKLVRKRTLDSWHGTEVSWVIVSGKWWS